MNFVKRAFLALSIVAASTAVAACGDDPDTDDKNAAVNVATNNVATNNTAANNTSTSANNMSTPANNMSTPANNMSTPNNNGGCAPLDPAIGPCDPVCQTGCETGQSCVFGSTGPGAPLTSTCVMAGQGTEGDTCAMPGDCAKGFICAGDGTGTGTCRESCDTDAATACDGGTCVQAVQEIDRIGVCAASCTPSPDTCTGGEQCYPADQTGGTLCASPGTVAVGDACNNLNECAAGSVCFNGTCAANCDTPGGQDSCEAGSVCRIFTGGFNVCIAECTPFPNDSCPQDQQCYPTNDGGTLCSNYSATAAVGDACQFINECGFEQSCVNSQCAALCVSAGDNSDCEAGETCANIPNTSINVCLAM